jgi:hypothetical protein
MWTAGTQKYHFEAVHNTRVVGSRCKDKAIFLYGNRMPGGILF